MGFLDKLFHGSKKAPREPPRVPLERADDGQIVYDDDLAGAILSELERRRDERMGYELCWTLNADFLSGHQNTEIDLHNRCVRTEERKTKGDRERRVYNRIEPLMDTRLAHLMSVNYDMVVSPRTNEAEDIAKAKISTKLLEYCQQVTNFSVQKDRLLAWMEVCGTAFTVSYWDKNAGEVIAQAVTAGADGVSVPQDIHLGDVGFGLLSPYEVFPASLTIESVEDQPSIITEQVFDVDTIRDLWGVEVEGEEIESYQLMPEAEGMTGHNRTNTTFGVSRVSRDNCQRVVTYYEPPSPQLPKGRYILVIKDRVVYYTGLPGGVMPIVAFKAKNQAGLFFGKSVIESLIPLQRSYNDLQNKIMDYAAVIVNAPLLTPHGSLDVDALADEGGVDSGMIIEYTDNNGEPHFLQYPNFPPVLIEQRNQIASDMEYTAGVSQLMVYGAAASSSSGKALQKRQEIDATRMSLTGDNVRNGVRDMAKLWLRLNKTFSTGYRAMLIAGDDDMGGIWTWCSEDINSYDVEFSAENELRRSPEQQKEDFMQAFQMGLFADENGVIPKEVRRRAWELLKLGELHDVLDIEDMQRKNAQRECVYFESGVIPDDDKYGDDEIHLEEHLRYALSNDYRMLTKSSPEYAALFDAHIEQHRRKIAAKQKAAQMQAMQMAALQQKGEK